MVSVRQVYFLEIIATVAISCIAFTVVFLLFPGFKAEAVPAWIQGVGSILGIGVAIYLSWWQSKLAAKSERQERARRLAVTEALVERGYQMAQQVEKHTKPIGNALDYYFAVIDPENMKATVAALKAIPLHTLESYNIVVGVQNIIVGLDKLEPFVQLHVSKGTVHYTFEGDDLKRAKYLCKKIAQARDLVRASIVELGHETSSLHPINMFL